MDIIFFAAVAIFIFLKLRKQLGQIDEEEKKSIEEKLAKRKAEILAMQQMAAEAERQIKLVGSAQSFGVNQASGLDDKLFANASAATKEQFFAVINSCKITADFFVNGVKMAFEMVIKAFAESDLETLQNLLSEKIYQSFSAAIDDRKSKSQILVTNLIAIESVEILSVNVVNDAASIVVKILSKQINYITESSGQIIKGNKTQISEVSDIWTFQKNVNSPNPNWLVSATHS